MGKVASVEDVVLQHEEDVEEHGEETETKLGGIAEDARPVVVVVRNQDHLQRELDNIPHHYHHHQSNSCEILCSSSGIPNLNIISTNTAVMLTT